MKVWSQEGRCRCGAELQQRVAPCPDKRPGCAVLHKEDYCVRCDERPGFGPPIADHLRTPFENAVAHRIQTLEARLMEFERTFQEHAEYMQKLQAQVDRHERRVTAREIQLDAIGHMIERGQTTWMDEANRRLGER